ncbi:hypothetical protein [Streptomyces sp. NBC_00645]|uniref:hypothetical protein n=1 Tax=Streptomyces sp. NBC_00645 TaxID=2975795 RepID=UPI00386ABDEF
MRTAATAPPWRNRAGLRGPARRGEEQGGAIVLLASDAASNINGVILSVDNDWASV